MTTAFRADATPTRTARVSESDGGDKQNNDQSNNNFLKHDFTLLSDYQVMSQALLVGNDAMVLNWFDQLEMPIQAWQHALHGWALLTTNDYKGAVAKLEMAVTQGVPAHGLLANAFHVLQMRGSALSVLEAGRAFVQDAPLEFQIFWHREYAEELSQTQPKEALRELDHALKLAFSNPRTLSLTSGVSIWKATVLTALGREDLALKAVRIALPYAITDLRRAQLLYRILISQINFGALPKAVRVISSVENYVDHPNVTARSISCYGLGRYYYAIDDYEKAKDYFHRALDALDGEVVFFAHLYLASVEQRRNSGDAESLTRHHLNRAKEMQFLREAPRERAHLRLMEARIAVQAELLEALPLAQEAVVLFKKLGLEIDLINAYVTLAGAWCVQKNGEIPPAVFAALEKAEATRQIHPAHTAAQDLSRSVTLTNALFDSEDYGAKLPPVAFKYLSWSVTHQQMKDNLRFETWEAENQIILKTLQEALKNKDHAAIIKNPPQTRKNPTGRDSETPRNIQALTSIVYAREGLLDEAAQLLHNLPDCFARPSAILELQLAQTRQNFKSGELEIRYTKHSIVQKILVVKVVLSHPVLSASLCMTPQGVKTTDYECLSLRYNVNGEADFKLYDSLTEEERWVKIQGVEFNQFMEMFNFLKS